jgi:hypothetical protein
MNKSLMYEALTLRTTPSSPMEEPSFWPLSPAPSRPGILGRAEQHVASAQDISRSKSAESK